MKARHVYLPWRDSEPITEEEYRKFLDENQEYKEVTFDCFSLVVHAIDERVDGWVYEAYSMFSEYIWNNESELFIIDDGNCVVDADGQFDEWFGDHVEVDW